MLRNGWNCYANLCSLWMTAIKVIPPSALVSSFEDVTIDLMLTSSTSYMIQNVITTWTSFTYPYVSISLSHIIYQVLNSLLMEWRWWWRMGRAGRRRRWERRIHSRLLWPLVVWRLVRWHRRVYVRWHVLDCQGRTWRSFLSPPPPRCWYQLYKETYW